MPVRDEGRQAIEESFNRRIGANVKALREHHDFTQEAMARHADMDVTKLSRVEAGERGLTLREGAMIAQYFGVGVFDLMSHDYTDPRNFAGRRARTQAMP